MIRILFVCHGNICRSPMGEFILKDMVRRAGLDREFEIASAATSTEEIGNPVYPPARKKLSEHGISCDGKRARQITRDDYWNSDMIVAMDEANVRNIARICGPDMGHKVSLLRSFSDQGGEVDDPWYTRDFDTCYDQIEAGCRGILDMWQKSFRVN